MDSIGTRATIGNAQVVCMFTCAVALTAIQSLCAQETTVDTAAHSFFEYEPTDLEPLFAASQATYVNSSVTQPYKTGTEVLPDGLLYRSYHSHKLHGGLNNELHSQSIDCRSDVP